MEPILEGMKELSESGDRGYRSKRVQVHEHIESISRLLGLSRAEVGEICIDIFTCICVEDITPEVDDFDATILDVKYSVYGSVDECLSTRR